MIFTARRLSSRLLYRAGALLTRAAVRIHPDGAAAITIGILGDEPSCGAWHIGYPVQARAAAILARVEADALDGHATTVDEIDEMTKTISKDAT